MGRTWLHRMRAIPSTFHQLLKFPGLKGTESIRGNQDSARSCFLTSIKSGPNAEQVKSIEVP